MTSAIARRVPAPLSVLTALATLALSAPLGLAAPTGHAAPLADDSASGIKLTSDIVVKSNDTYTSKIVINDSTGLGIFNESNCNSDSLAGAGIGGSDVKATFKEDGDTTVCTLEESGPIKDSNDLIKHEGNKYVVKTGSDNAGSASQVDVTQTVTFPGKVTDADGGKVDGNKVTFTDIDTHTVKGSDGSTPMWVWILVGVGVLAVVGGGAAAFFITRSRKNRGQPAYGAPVQGYDPNQAFPAQPDQQAGYGTPQAQPDQQAGYGTPQAQQQPGQPPYGTDQPGQGAY
ncbi:hypothetical protein E4J66_13485 [Actinomyces viscosus]|uniref:LppM domain-containing protein n=1 Tax=Actinomyces viscosus TaxID=1656 RepID=A0A3S4Z2E5_ACTVI|nr:hypothetical protein [Actinomyces viscosus]TFH51007.1 hypothetical protein E4J66_13485 [Actinomyces viscosus]VEI16742.1 Uncharacterised protein [Actinomyces viscosus]